MSCSLDSSKVHINVGDGFQYVKEHPGVFDIIITDSSDPVGKYSTSTSVCLLFIY